MPPPSNPHPPDPHGLFTDGPPRWIVNSGKSTEAPCETAEEARQQRDAAAFKLRWHGNHSVGHTALVLADKLRACSPARPCLSGACPICERAQQRLFVRVCVSVVKPPHPLFGGALKALSIIPDFGRVPLSGLATFNIVEFIKRTRRSLHKAAITLYILGLDVSLNHEDGEFENACWQFQWWGFFDEPVGPWRKTLSQRINASKSVSRPIMAPPVDSIEATAAYGLKSVFKRRVSYLKANLDRDDRGACRDTNNRSLRGEPWVDLMLCLDRIGLEKRLIGHGYGILFEPLRSRPTLAEQSTR